MDDTNLAGKVGELRSQGLTPKQIAKTLGVRRADVEPLIRVHAQAASTAVVPAVVGCWANPGWETGLRWAARPAWCHGLGVEVDDVVPQLASVLLARKHRYGKIVVCGYLVDSMCLGVKNALGPRVMEQHELSAFVGQYFRAYDDEPVAVPLELAQHLVLGAIEYARHLGFEPHPDFAACREHLGTWTGPSALHFGYRGKPRFIPGPHDDVEFVVSTLERSVGRGNFDFGISLD